MASGKLKCRVCGKEYEACRSARIASGAYRWQDVACCPEHGAEYLNKVLIARGMAGSATKKNVGESTSRKPKKKQVVPVEEEALPVEEKTEEIL